MSLQGSDDDADENEEEEDQLDEEQLLSIQTQLSCGRASTFTAISSLMESAVHPSSS